MSGTSHHLPRLRDLSLLDAASVLWWRIGLTPTSRMRARRFEQSIRDRRGRDEALRMARNCRK